MFLSKTPSNRAFRRAFPRVGALLLATSLLACAGNDDASSSDKKSDKKSDKESDKKNKEDGDKKKEPEKEEVEAGSKAIGEQCSKDKECASSKCREVSFVNPLNNDETKMQTCAACETDKECQDKDDGIACVPVAKVQGVTSFTVSYSCSEGDKGNTCEEKEQCKDGLTCSAITLAGSKSDLKTCGECESDDDCEGDTPVCSTVGLAQFAPYNSCVAKKEESEEKDPEEGEKVGKNDGEQCSGEGEAGNKECKNYCRSFGGLINLCVACLEDAHCEDGKTCKEGQLNPADPTASKLPRCE